MENNKPTKQAKGVSPISGIAPPVKNQFGQPNGNPRHNGAWKKEDTLRYKWEQIMKMEDDELLEVLKDPKCGRVGYPLFSTLHCDEGYHLVAQIGFLLVGLCHL